MKGASKVIMGATVVMVVSLAVVLSLVLVLLAELYCNLILRRRQQRLEAASSLIDTPITTAATTPTTLTAAAAISSSSPSDLPFTAPPGVLQAPRSFLFPATKEASKHFTTTNRSHQSLHHVLELYSPRDDSSSPNATASPQQIGLLRTPPPPASYLSSPQEIRDISAVQVSSPSPSSALHKEATNDKKEQQHFIYISNPIYDNNSRISCNGGGDTPFETPDTSPSRFEESCSSGSDDEVAQGVVRNNNSESPLLLLAHTNNSITITPPLTPMKKLPAEASSVSLRDARSLGTSGSDSVSNVNVMSSSSSGTPCTSPSW